MNRNAFLIAIFAILMYLAAPHRAFGQGPNLTQNSSFESGLTGWSWSTAGAANASCTVITATPHSGIKSVCLTYTGNLTANTYGKLTQTISGLTVGNTYCITLWCKGTAVGSAEQVATGTGWQYRATLPSGSYGWTSVNLTFVADATSVPLVVLTQNTTTQLQIDDISLSSSPPNLVQNGGFESGLTGWTWGVAGGASTHCNVVTTSPHTGADSVSLDYSGTQSGGTYGVLSRTISGLTIGNTYCVTLWCKGNLVGSAQQVAAGTQWQFRAALPSGSYNWKSVCLTFVADATSVPLVVLAQDATQQLQIDDITLSTPAINTVSVPSALTGQTKSVPGGLGISTHNIAPSSTELQLMRDAGFTFLRVDLDWTLIEPTARTYRFQGVSGTRAFNYDTLVSAAASYGMQVCFILDYTNPLYDGGHSPYTTTGRQAFTNFALAAVNHFQGKKVLWEIYNEPNNFWTFSSGATANALDPVTTASVAALYAPLAMATSQALKTSYPSEIVIGPAMGWFNSEATSPYFDNTMNFLGTCFQQGICQYFDGISVHPYRGAPESSLGDYSILWNSITNSANNTTGKFPAIVDTEWGYSSSWYDAPQGSQTYIQAEQTKGGYISRSLLSNIMNGVNLSIVYDWMDDGTVPANQEHNFGMVANYDINLPNPTISPLNAYYAVKTIHTQLAGYTYSGRISTGDGSDYILSFTSGSKVRYVCWNSLNLSHAVTIPAAPGVAITDTSYDGGWVGNFNAGATGGFYCTLASTPQYIVAAGQ